MLTKFLHIFKILPPYLVLLPVFFIAHGLNEYNALTLVEDALELILIYTAAALLLTAILCLYLKDIRKAALLTFTLMSFNFFFGSAYDFLQSQFKNIFPLKYSFIIPFALILFLLLLIALKKTKKPLFKLNQFLNLLLCMLIVIDTSLLVSKSINNNEVTTTSLSKQLQQCDTCSKPDIYLIIADEYAGKKELNEVLGFDNSAFETELKNRGFHINDSTVSNYNATVYSMSSLFSMDYVQNLKSSTINHRDILLCREIINKNNMQAFLKKTGYTIYNYSPFQFNDQAKAIFNPFFPTKKSLFTAQTFISRFMKNVGFNFFSKQEVEKIKKHHYYNNKTIEELTLDNIKNKPSPKFVYIHLALPHHPYYYDRNGKEVPIQNLTEEWKMNKDAYNDYLIYTNNKLLSLIDQIKAESSGLPLIMLMSDHGFRQLSPGTDHKYQFMNLNAVLLPGRNYSGFYNGMSNVNQFRVILNSQFGQKLPLLKDSTSFLIE